MKRAPDRWIGYAVVNAEHVAMSRSHYRDLAHQNAFGVVLRDGPRILVRVSGVRRWLRDGCRSLRQLIDRRDETRPGEMEGMSARAQGRRAGSTDDYAANAAEFDPIAARDGTVPGTVAADHGPSHCSAVRPPGRCMTSPRPERHRGNGEAGGTPDNEKPARSGRACSTRRSEKHPGPGTLVPNDAGAGEIELSMNEEDRWSTR